MTGVSKYSAILFDADGTLLDTREYIFQAFEYALRQHGIDFSDRTILAPLMGTPLESVYEKIAPDHDSAVLAVAHREFQRHHGSLVQPYPKVREALLTLQAQDLKLALITSRQEHVMASLADAGIADLFSVVVTGNDVQRHKPDPEGLLAAMKQLSVSDKREAVMVGDTPSDIEAARNAGVVSVGVTWGFFGPAIEQAHPDYIVESFAELIRIIGNKEAE